MGLQLGHVTNSLNGKLRHLLPVEESSCTIYRVHTHLRNVNVKAYEPEVIAIGPYHRGRDNLENMEHHKLRYMQLLLDRNTDVDIGRYVEAIGRSEQRARKCYAEPIGLNATEFVEMLVLDGCFIVELVRKFDMKEMRADNLNDPVFHLDWIMNSLQRDLMLFENQIPFFILCELFALIERPNNVHRFIYLLFRFFGSLVPKNRILSDNNLDGVSHLLSMIHTNWHVPFDRDANRVENNKFRSIKSASELKVHNVQFKKNEDVATLSIRFESSTMVLAPLSIEDRTECLFRNLIAYEQYLKGNQYRFVTDYVILLDYLIDSSKDVAILSENGIVDNRLGDDQVVANMVNRLADMIIGGTPFIYGEVLKDVEKHCEKRQNRWKALLWTNYLNSPWGVISIFFAVVLLLLTLTQTICSIVQVK